MKIGLIVMIVYAVHIMIKNYIAYQKNEPLNRVSLILAVIAFVSAGPSPPIRFSRYWTMMSRRMS